MGGVSAGHPGADAGGPAAPESKRKRSPPRKRAEAIADLFLPPKEKAARAARRQKEANAAASGDAVALSNAAGPTASKKKSKGADAGAEQARADAGADATLTAAMPLEGSDGGNAAKRPRVANVDPAAAEVTEPIPLETSSSSIARAGRGSPKPLASIFTKQVKKTTKKAPKRKSATDSAGQPPGPSAPAQQPPGTAKGKMASIFLKPADRKREAGKQQAEKARLALVKSMAENRQWGQAVRDELGDRKAVDFSQVLTGSRHSDAKRQLIEGDPAPHPNDSQQHARQLDGGDTASGDSANLAIRLRELPISALPRAASTGSFRHCPSRLCAKERPAVARQSVEIISLEGRVYIRWP